MGPSDPRRVMDVLKRYAIPEEEAEQILEESLLVAVWRAREGRRDLQAWIETIVEARCREYAERSRTLEEGDLEDDDEPSGS